MKLSSSQIYEGWKNNLFPAKEIKEKIATIGAQRMEICRSCNYNSEVRKVKLKEKILRPDEHCTHCGCTLAAKTKCLSCECPIKRWTAVLSEEKDFDEKWRNQIYKE